MKATLLVTVLFGLFLASGCGSDKQDAPEFEGSGGGDVEFEDFEEPLAEHGTWVEIEDYGMCWHPADVDDDWRPYCYGHWVWVDDCGWYWVSDYEWGWACEHYGRWVHHHHRWYWVPGYEWSGAWVVWRDGGGYVGWAALPPTVSYSVSVGVHSDVHWDTVIYEPGWVFVAHVDFTAPRLRSVVVHHHQTSVILHKTSIKGSISVSGGRAMNHAIKLHEAEKFTGKKVPRRKMEATSDHRSARGDDGDKVKAYRPKARERDERDKPAPREGDRKPERDTEKKPPRESDKPDRDTEKKPERESERKPTRESEKPDREPEKKPGGEREKQPERKKRGQGR